MGRRFGVVLVAALSLVLGAIVMTPAEAAVITRTVRLTNPGAVMVGAPFAIYGQVSRSGKAAPVVIYKKVGSGSWTRTRVVRTRDTKGNFIFKTTLGSPATVRFRAVAPKLRRGTTTYKATTSRPVTVTPRITWADKYFNDEWSPYDGSASPGFAVEYADGTYGYFSRFSGSDPVGTTAYVTWDLKGQCTTGSLRLASPHGGIFGSDIRFDVEADGVQLASVTLGEGQERLREIDATDASKLKISATFLGPGGTNNGAGALIHGDSFLSCWSTL